jgi:hypothetical protein
VERNHDVVGPYDSKYTDKILAMLAGVTVPSVEGNPVELDQAFAAVPMRLAF